MHKILPVVNRYRNLLFRTGTGYPCADLYIQVVKRRIEYPSPAGRTQVHIGGSELGWLEEMRSIAPHGAADTIYINERGGVPDILTACLRKDRHPPIIHDTVPVSDAWIEFQLSADRSQILCHQAGRIEKCSRIDLHYKLLAGVKRIGRAGVQFRLIGINDRIIIRIYRRSFILVNIYIGSNGIIGHRNFRNIVIRIDRHRYDILTLIPRGNDGNRYFYGIRITDTRYSLF